LPITGGRDGKGRGGGGGGLVRGEGEEEKYAFYVSALPSKLLCPTGL